MNMSTCWDFKHDSFCRASQNFPSRPIYLAGRRCLVLQYCISLSNCSYDSGKHTCIFTTRFMRTLQHTRIPVEHLEKWCVLSRLWVSHIEGKGKRWQMFIPGVWVLGTVFGEKGFDCARCTFRWIDASRSMRNYNLFCTKQSIQFCIDLKHTKNKTDCSIFILILWLKKDFKKPNSCLSLTTAFS